MLVRKSNLLSEVASVLVLKQNKSHIVGAKHLKEIIKPNNVQLK